MLNYKQLHYFWAVAKAGSIVRASERLHLTPQTLSGQIGVLEETLGVSLFLRVGRRLELTETGQLALSYADEARSGMSWKKRCAAVRKAAPFSFVWVSTMPFPSPSLIGC